MWERSCARKADFIDVAQIQIALPFAALKIIHCFAFQNGNTTANIKLCKMIFSQFRLMIFSLRFENEKKSFQAI